MKPDRNYYLGKTLPGGYTLQRFIGAGAFAYVYWATNPQGHQVAVKVQYNLADDARKRFAREIKVLQQLPPSEYVIQYFGDGVTPEGLPFLVMEFVDGATLKESLKYKPVWSTVEGSQFMIQLCDAFGGLHQLGLAHRDVKPDNIMLTRQWRVKLMDLGLVKDAQGLLQLFEAQDILKGRDFAENLDRGVLAGTPEYMAPEQFSDPSLEDESLAKTDTWTDVYSLGLIFYELLTGTKLFPFKPNTASQGDYARSLLDYLKLRTEQRDEDLHCPPMVPEPLWTILQRSLRADPKLRQRNAPELGEDLRRYVTTGEGIAIQDEDKTSSIDLNKFLAAHGVGRKGKAPAAPAPQNPPPQPSPPQPDPHAASTYPMRSQEIQQRSANHPPSALQAPLGNGVPPSGPYASNPFIVAPQQVPDNTVLWIILVVLLIIGMTTAGVFIFLS